MPAKKAPMKKAASARKAVSKGTNGTAEETYAKLQSQSKRYRTNRNKRGEVMPTRYGSKARKAEELPMQRRARGLESAAMTKAYNAAKAGNKNRGATKKSAKRS